MAYRSPLGRRNTLSIIASFFVIAAGLCGCIVIAIIGGQNDRKGLFIAIRLALIAMIPLGSLRPDRSLEEKEKRVGFWQSMRGVFGRQPDRELKVTTWRRKTTDFIATPHGSEYANVFQPEREKPENGSPAP